MEQKLHNYLRKWLLPIFCSLLVLGLAARGTTLLWAAPHLGAKHQTIPPPTFTPQNTPVPTATPVADDDDEPDDEPTTTPTDDASDDDSGENSEDESFSDNDDNDEQDNSDSSNGGDSVGLPSDPDSAIALPTAKVKAIVLNVRSGPGTEFAVVGTVFQDDELTISGRSGAWWQVCCAIGATEPGWVDSQFVEAEFDVEAAQELIPEIATDVTTSRAASSSSAGTSTSALNRSILEIEISHEPAFVWQESSFDMTFLITNTSPSTAEDVQIRNDFPPELLVVGVADANGDSNSDEVVDATDESEISDGINGRKILVASWGEIAGGESRSLRIKLEVRPDVEMGSVINNLAVVTASNAEDVTAGISIGMPPIRLPTFR